MLSSYSQQAQEFARKTWATWTAQDAKESATESFRAAATKVSWPLDRFPPAADREGTVSEQAAGKALSLLRTLNSAFVYLLLAMSKGMLPDATPDYLAASAAVNNEVIRLIPLIRESAEAEGYTKGYKKGIEEANHLQEQVLKALQAAWDWAKDRAKDVGNYFDGQFDYLKKFLEALFGAAKDAAAAALPWLIGGVLVLFALFAVSRPHARALGG